MRFCEVRGTILEIIMRVNIKKLNSEAVIPTYAKKGDAGMDLTAIKAVKNDGVITYHTGLAIEIPKGYVGLIFPRSSVYKTKLIQSNAVGVIDSSYRGEIMIKHYVPKIVTGRRMFPDYRNIYKVGDRVAQLMIVPYPEIEFTEVEELSTTERGAGGYGSTGN